MFIKKNENGEIVTVVFGCTPDDVAGFIEVEDDASVLAAYVTAHQPTAPTSTDSRIAELESAMMALVGGVTE